MNNDQIEQFKQFMEFIQNVDKYKQTIEDLQAATQEYNKAVAALEFGDNLLDAKDNLDADRVKFTKDSKDAQDSFAMQVATKVQHLADKESGLGDREAQLMQKERDLNERENQIKINESTIASRLADSDAAAVKLAAAQADVQARSIDLATKAAQIQQLVS